MIFEDPLNEQYLTRKILWMFKMSVPTLIVVAAALLIGMLWVGLSVERQWSCGTEVGG